MIENLDRVFKQTQKAGLKLSIKESQFGKNSVEFLRKTISTAGIAPIEKRRAILLENLKLPSNVKTLQRYLGSANYNRQYIPRLTDKIVPLHLLLRGGVFFKLTQQHKDTISANNECLLKTSKFSSKLPLTDKQLAVFCDASEHAAGYALLTEDYRDEETAETNKFAPVVFGKMKKK